MEEEYKDLSEVVDEVKLSRKVSIQELHSAIVGLTRLLNDMFAMFKTASDQIKVEEKQSEETHKQIIEKLDKAMEENKTIAASIVAIADIVRAKEEPKQVRVEQKPEMPKFNPPIMNQPNFAQQQPSFGPTPQPSTPYFNIPPQMPPQQAPRFGPQPGWQPPAQPPPLNERAPPPLPDLDIPDLDEPFPFEEEKKKKGLLGMFKK